MQKKTKPLLGITLGDPCGIGPEVVIRALTNRRARSAARFLVFGSGVILEQVAGKLKLRMPRLQPVATYEETAGRPGPFILESISCPKRLALLGKPTAVGGGASIEWIENAIRHAVGGRIKAIVTAPINKEAVLKGGHNWPGHTELLAAKSGAPKPVMTMVGGGLRAALVTTHVAIKDLPGKITKANVLKTIRIVDVGFRRDFGIKNPRIIVCGLNPHAGEAGRFGSEERTAITPAIKRAQADGIKCDGPLPADVVFTKDCVARYDAIVAMYHDQANIPVKMIAFDSGVNVTLGLPIIRTSPDHGTAYDIVRKGIASPGSMVAAILLAADMARKRGSAR